jgi:hypothetical protein
MLLGSGMCLYTLGKFTVCPAARIFSFYLKGWVVTCQELALPQAYIQQELHGREDLQHCAYLDAHTGLPKTLTQACFQLQSAMLHFGA